LSNIVEKCLISQGSTQEADDFQNLINSFLSTDLYYISVVKKELFKSWKSSASGFVLNIFMKIRSVVFTRGC